MNERVLKCLYDIKIAAEEIDSFFESESRDFENYKGNSLLKRAIEMRSAFSNKYLIVFYLVNQPVFAVNST